MKFSIAGLYLFIKLYTKSLRKVLSGTIIMEIKEGAISECKLLVNIIKTDYKAVLRLLHYISF